MEYVSISKNAFHGENNLSYACDSLVTAHHFAGAVDVAFQKALEKARGLCEHPLYHQWRLYLAVSIQRQLISQCLRNSSTYLYTECGVGEGHTLLVSHFYFEYIGGELFDLWNKSEKFLCDTFAGVDSSLIDSKDDDREFITTPYHGATLEKLQDRFSMIPNIAYIVGSIPSSLDFIPLSKRSPSFLHIDLNHYVPELAALKYFYLNMQKGSSILFDDYSFQSARTQRDEIDKWCATCGYALPLNLPTGQGLIHF